LKNLSVAPLPLKRSLAREYGVSIAIAVLIFVASATGIVFREIVYPLDELAVGFVATDVLNLAAGLPILLISMWLTRKGHLIGLLCWPGALLYVLYIYTSYLALPIRALSIPYILLIPLSAYSVIRVIMNINSAAVRQQISEAVPARSTGYILTGIAVLVIAYQLVDIATSLVNQAPPDRMALVQWLDDLVLGSPAIFGGGYLLLRRRALGYVAGAGLLLMCSLLFIGVIPAMIFQALSAGTSVDLVGILVVLATGMVCFIPFVLYVRGVATTRPKGSSWQTSNGI
jgi:hypothetical protein